MKKTIFLVLCLIGIFSFSGYTQTTKANTENPEEKHAKLPEFPGGMKSLVNFLQTNLRYPSSAKAKGISGTVKVEFIVDKTGKVTSPRILQSVHPALDGEALRVVKLMPKWAPGETADGEKVKCFYQIPIVFSLE